MFRTSKFFLLSALVALLLSISAVPAAFAQPNTQAACEQTYIVQKGDWLSTIALKFLGDVKAYPSILQATNDAAKTDSSFATIADANKIEVGQKLCIPAVTAVPGRELAGIYTTVGPAADASALVETLVLGGDGQVRYTLDYIGKASIDAKGTWKQEGNTVTVLLYEQAGKATKQTMTFTVQDGNLVATNPPNATYTKTAPDVAFYSGLYTANRSSADGSETLTALALLPNGEAQLTLSSSSNPFILQTGTWKAGTNPDTNTPSITVNLTKQGDQTIEETYVFQVDGENLRGTQYNADKWGTDLTFTKFHAPAEPQTPASGAAHPSALAGIYTTVGPAADASALVETLELGADGKASYTLDYIGKASIDAQGTWKQEGDTVTVTLTEQAGKPTAQTMTFTVKDGNLVATTPPNATYAKTTPEVAAYSGLYTANRASADGSETLTSLTLLPNGQAQMTLSSSSNPFILQTGTWTTGTISGTSAPSVTVNLTKQGDQTINETYVFQVDGDNLRGTEYNKDKWGTDLTFTKFDAPAEPQTPASIAEQLAAHIGSYTAQLPAADAIGRVLVLDLMADNKTTLTTQFIGKGEPIVDNGTWTVDQKNVVVELEDANSKQTLTFAPNGSTLVLQNPEEAGYGSAGLTLTRVGSGNVHTAEFGGVSLSFDDQLAKSAQGQTLKAVPVTEGPALGGATPAAVLFTFNGQTLPEFLDPSVAQVLVYKTEDWTKLDPTTAKSVEDLQALLKNKPADFAEQIPVLPPFPATQVFHVHPKYFDFKNGTGVGFVTYYAQDVSPVLADRIFYVYQGLTNDGKYYVTVFYPVTTALLPSDHTAALGGQSDEEWAKNYETYLAALIKDLDGLVPAAYTPNLMLVEELVKSINISETTLQ
jgi:hypothetical protein